MITEQKIQEAIAECQGVRSPNANTAIKLAAFYTILDHINSDLRPDDGTRVSNSFSGYSLADSPIVSYGGETEFAKTIAGKRQEDVWPVLDELMSTIRLMNDRLYSGVIKKLSQ